MFQSGEYILTGIPHMCGSGSTTTTEPDGFGSVRSVRLWNPYIHLDPDRYEEMVKKIGFQGNNLDDKRVNPYGGVFLVEWTQPFSVKRSEVDHRYHNYSSSDNIMVLRATTLWHQEILVSLICLVHIFPVQNINHVQF